MIKLFFALFISFGISNSIFAQTQISHFENIQSIIKYTRSGVEKIDDLEYLIETNSNSLRVSRIQDSVQLIYEVADYPIDDSLINNYGRMNTRSGYIVDDIFLFEFFRHQIRKRNILTGEIVETYAFNNNEILSTINMEIVGNIFHLETGDLGHLSYFNTLTQEFTKLPHTKNTAYREGNFYYFKEDPNEPFQYGLLELNVVNDSVTKIFQNEQVYFLGTDSKLDGLRGLIFGSIEETRFFNRDTSFLINCDFFWQIATEVNIHESKDHYNVFHNTFGTITFEIKNKSNCASIISETYSEDSGSQHPLKIFDFPSLDENYLLFATNYRSYSETKLWLYDKNTLTITLIDEELIFSIDDNSFYRSENELYFIGRMPAYDLTCKTLYSLNLDTKQLRTNQEAFSYIDPISFGHSESDSSLFLARDQYATIILYQFFDGSNVEEVYTPNDTRNVGLNSIRYLAIDDEKLVFKFKNGIYLADNSSNSNDKTSFIMQASDISNLLIDNNIIKGLVNFDDTTYHFKYQLDNGTMTTTALNDFVAQDINSVAYDSHIFGEFSLEEKKYFDLNTSTFMPIEVDNEILSMHKSNHNMLFLSTCDGGYCLTSFLDGSFTQLQDTYQTEPTIYSKENGAYMIVELMAENESQVSILNLEGILGDQITINGEVIINSTTDDIEEGPLSALMFYNDQTENLEIVMHRYQKMHSYILPFMHAPIAPIIWYKAGNSIILKSDDDDEDAAGIYVCTLGKELKKLTISEQGDRYLDLLYASHDDGKINFITYSQQSDIEIIQYDIETENLNITPTDFDLFSFSWFITNPIFRISPSLYLVTFNYQYWFDVFENSELYIFDSENLTFLPGKNLNQRYQQSDPRNFIESPSHLFFVARSHPDNSYQLYVQAKETITSVDNSIPEVAHFKVYPNPSASNIYINDNANLIQLYDQQGSLVKTIHNYKNKHAIDISNLKTGIYFIEALQTNNISTTSFVKK